METQYIPICFSLNKKDTQKLEELMNLTKIHNKSHLVRLLIDYFTVNKDKIKELIKK